MTSTVNLVYGLVPEDSFSFCVNQWRSSFEGAFYLPLLAWDEEASKLIGSRLQIELHRYNETTEIIKQVTDLRELAGVGPKDSFAFSQAFFWYEHFLTFQSESFMCLLSSVFLIFLIILVTVADILGALLICAMVSSILLGQLSTLALLGESLNLTTIAATIMAIGLSVDYSVHFYYCCKTGKEGDGSARVSQAMNKIGVGILHGGITTLIAVIPLYFEDYFTIQIFVKSWVSVVVYGLGHGLVLLPVLLSFQKRKQVAEKEKILEVELLQNIS